MLVTKYFFKNISAQKSFYILIFFMMLLLLFGGYSGWKQVKLHNEMMDKYQTEARQDWINNPDKHPHRMAHYGNYAFRPSASLGFFDTGLERYLGNSIYLEAHVQNSNNFSDSEYATGLIRFGTLDLAMILQYLVPLFIFFIGFSCISSEYENGTLKLGLSQGISWIQLMAGKWFGVFGTVLFILLPAILFTGVWLIRSPFSNADMVYRFIFLFIAYSAYLSLWSLITVLVSAHSHTSRGALNALIGIWFMAFILMPKVTQTIGSAFYKIPSKASFESGIEAEIVKVGDSHNPDDPHYQSLKDSILKLYQVDSINQLPVNYAGLQMKEGERISSEIHASHHKNLIQIYRKQNDLGKWCSLVNPYMTIKNLSMTLCGTDFETYVDFQQQAEDYRYLVSQKMNELQIQYISNQAKGSSDKRHILSQQHWGELQPFIYHSHSWKRVLGVEKWSILSICLWSFGMLCVLIYSSEKLKAV